MTNKLIKNSDLKKSISTFKENFTYIILIPALLGGIWQLFELSSISTSYIRFFSITQIVPDGLLILFILSLFYISFKLSFFMINSDLEKDKNGNMIERKLSIKRHIAILIISVITLLFFGYIFKPFDKLVLSELIVSLLIIIPMSSNILLSLKNIGVVIHKKHPKLIKNSINSFILRLVVAISSIFLVLFLIIFFFRILSTFSASYSFPKNLKNIKELNKSIDKEYPKFQNEILYLNDKYIFIDLIDKNNNKKQLILEFKNIFQNKSNDFEKETVAKPFLIIKGDSKKKDTLKSIENNCQKQKKECQNLNEQN